MHAKCLVPLETASGDGGQAAAYSAHPIANALSSLQPSFTFTQQPKYVQVYRKYILQKGAKHC